MAELGLDRRQEGLDRLGVPDVELTADGPATQPLDVGDRGGQALGVAVTDRHVGAEAGQAQGAGRADALGATGDHGDPVGQQHPRRADLQIHRLAHDPARAFGRTSCSTRCSDSHASSGGMPPQRG